MFRRASRLLLVCVLVLASTQDFYAQKTGNFISGIKSNLLYDVALTPNIGVEFHLGKGWSIGADWAYAWWNNEDQHFFHRVYGGDLDVRKYFGRKSAERPLSGHHIGLYGQMLTYDFAPGGADKGILSKLSYGAGLGYGYSHPIADRLNLDFEIGIGYLGGEYEVYTPIDDHYVWQETRQRFWIGPTKVGISLVWIIDRNTFRKGGAR